MQLYAALVPPPDVLAKVHSAVAGVAPVADRTVEGKRGLLRRRKDEPVLPAGPMLHPVPAEAMHLVMTKFGNLALSDVEKLADALDREARTWATPRLRLAGGIAREPEGDTGVWVRLAGDVDALETLTKGVHAVAQAQHLLVDRRGFRPEVQVGTTTRATSDAYLDALVAALDEFESNAFWQTTISLLTPADLGPGQPPFKTHRDIPLGPAVAH